MLRAATPALLLALLLPVAAASAATLPFRVTAASSGSGGLIAVGGVSPAGCVVAVLNASTGATTWEAVIPASLIGCDSVTAVYYNGSHVLAALSSGYLVVASQGRLILSLTPPAKGVPVAAALGGSGRVAVAYASRGNLTLFSGSLSGGEAPILVTTRGSSASIDADSWIAVIVGDAWVAGVSLETGAVAFNVTLPAPAWRVKAAHGEAILVLADGRIVAVNDTSGVEVGAPGLLPGARIVDAEPLGGNLGLLLAYNYTLRRAYVAVVKFTASSTPVLLEARSVAVTCATPSIVYAGNGVADVLCIEGNVVVPIRLRSLSPPPTTAAATPAGNAAALALGVFSVASAVAAAYVEDPRVRSALLYAAAAALLLALALLILP